MTTATALAAQAAVRFKDPNNRVISNTQWLEYLNQAYKKVNAASPLWPWLESTEETVAVALGARSGDLPANVYQVNWVYDATNDCQLFDMQGRGEQWNQGLRTDTGKPIAYRIRAGKVELFPLPDTIISLRMECVEYPVALSGLTTVVGSVDGAIAGDHTIAGIAAGDSLVSVVTVLNAGPFTTADVTSEYTVTLANTINNTGGASSVGKRLVATYQHQTGTGSPVYPAVYHEDLIDGMLAYAYLDDGSTEQYTGHLKAFEAAINKMLLDMLMFRSERNPPIRDTFFG